MQNTMSLSFLLLGLCLWLVMARFQSFPAFTLFKSNLVFDDFSMKVSILLVGATIVCLLLSRDYVAEEKVNFFEFSILVLLSCLGGCWLVASYDFFTMYMTIELLSLPLYALASIKTRSLLSTEAGLKYFILGAFSSGMFLFGVSLLYFATGSLSFSEIGQLGMTSDTLTTETCAYLMGLFFVLVGLICNYFS